MTVAVLLSTYNGERHLPALLDSLAGQTHGDWRLVIRDDGSRDGTVALLQAFATSHPGRISLEIGPNLGAVASFLALLRRPEADAGAVAVCEQDDVWHADKLARATEHLSSRIEAPALYFTRARLVDDGLQPLGLSPPFGRVGFDQALFENAAIGCTTVFNRAAYRLLSSRLPEATGVVVHDWWCYLVVSALGEVFYDPSPSVDYRLHPGNVIGLPQGPVAAVATQLRRLLRAPSRFYEPHRQAKALLDCFGDRLSPQRKAVVEELVAAKSRPLRRLRLALTGPVRRERPLDTLIARALIAVGLY
jgi:glycosyltransferase involved in cell wall biosynthesis